MTGTDNQVIVAAEPLRINGCEFAPGSVLGEVRDGKPVATAAGVDDGNLTPRIRDGRANVVSVPQGPGPGPAPGDAVQMPTDQPADDAPDGPAIEEPDKSAPGRDAPGSVQGKRKRKGK